ncbi:helix-turn-helix transcriptional regulator [Jeotgalibaca sp. MA1X17-3]|uniref:helix-turn-helix transcriptional regulator n=1 Tax=Jeotgalibaca sp. MA1X17-3 TaxID=2908211 RepID=UPI001F3A705D|nr:response regulator transcription factor [Jeotgalibaca sp. MA1X17-3]UJF15667.1 helix-turn-helix transcriptional regulator [Jeotgalibaca sp. MA1X17-3]
MKKQFMLNLYRNRIIKSELENKMKLYQYPLENKQTYALMLIQLDDYGDREIKNKDIFLFGINEMVKELIPTELRLTPIVLNDEIQVTMLIFKEDTFEQSKKVASEYARTIIKTLKDYMKISVSISFSPFYDQLLESKENLDKGKEALTYHLILGKQAVIFYHEVEELLAVPEISQYPEELENNLFQSIRLGEVDKANDIAPIFLEKIFMSSNNPINVQVALLRFVLNLIQLSQSMKSEFLTEEQGVELYGIILNTHNPSELEFTLIKDLILPLVEEMSEKTSQQFKGLSEQIIEIIESEYMEDISLELIGDRLHYNPNYLSNIFKKEAGITFSDYLTGFRFDIAKKWLRETDVTIKVISQKLQYRNPQNFIRSFKKKENMTPGEYRKMHTPL